jgi:hypothetical protein
MLTAHLKSNRIAFTERFELRVNQRVCHTPQRAEIKDVDIEILQQFKVGIDWLDCQRKCVITESLSLVNVIVVAAGLENVNANVKGLHR